MFKYKLVLTLTLIFIFIFNFGLYASEDIHYTTITGELNLVGTGELNHVIINNNNKTYTLSGNFVNELKQLLKSKVRITGEVSSSNYPNTEGEIKVIDYSIINPKTDNKQSWVYGKIYKSSDRYILIDRNQIIYKITNFDILDVGNYKDKKFLLIGSTKQYTDYYAELEISSYKIIDID